MLALPSPPGGPAKHLAGRLAYHTGRVMTYGLLGLMAGVAGKSLLLAGLQQWLSITLGLAILAGFLLARKIAFNAPVLRVVGRLKTLMAIQLHRRSLRSLALLGLLNGLLPCGLTYVAMAGAAARASALAGLIYMVAFGFGTWPMMLSISLSGKVFPPVFRSRLRGLIPAGVCILAALLILRGLSLGIPYVSPDLIHGGPGNCCAH